jgi:hypothetical protein
MIKKFTLLGLMSLGVLLVAPRPASAQKAELVREEFHQSYPMSANARISLENIQGAVRILAWDRNEVKVDAVKSAYSRELLNEAQIKIDATGDTLRIRTEYPDGNLTFNSENDGDYRHYKNPASVEYTLSVPRNARLSSIELVNGGLEIDGVAGDVNASCVNGKVTARHLKGEVKLGTVNGGLEATFDTLYESKAISLGSVNGGVVIIIPSDSNAVVKAGTVHGGIKNDFGLPVREGDYVGRELYGQIGRGGTRVKLGNVNGSVNIRRASDGRSLSPSTSLLSAGVGVGKGKGMGMGIGVGSATTKSKAAKDKDKEGDAVDWDDDWDSDNDGGQEARRSARDAQREAARAQREAQRAQIEAKRTAVEAQRAVIEAQREAQREAAVDVREASREAVEAARAAQAVSARAVREAQREVVRVAREVSRAAVAEADRAVRIYGDSHFRLVERDVARFDVSDSPRVNVETFDGTVSVHGWDKSEVVVNVVKRAANEQAMRGIRFNAVKDGNQIKIVALFDKAFAQRVAQGVTTVNANVNLEIFVPRKVVLRANSGDGYLALDGVNGDVDLVTADGSIDVVDGRGRILAKTADGRIRIVKFDGAAEATTGDGRITLEGRFAQLTARTGDGSITLVLPANFDAIIETDAERVINESGLTVTEEPASSKRLRRWKVGKGGTVLSLRTGQGRIILRRTDGQ